MGDRVYWPTSCWKNTPRNMEFLKFPSGARWIGSAIVGRPVNAVKHNMDITTTTTNTDTLGLEGDFRTLDL